MLPDVCAFIIALLLKKSTVCDILNTSSTPTLMCVLLSGGSILWETSILFFAQLLKRNLGLRAARMQQVNILRLKRIPLPTQGTREAVVGPAHSLSDPSPNSLSTGEMSQPASPRREITLVMLTLFIYCYKYCSSVQFQVTEKWLSTEKEIPWSRAQVFSAQWCSCLLVRGALLLVNIRGLQRTLVMPH